MKRIRMEHFYVGLLNKRPNSELLSSEKSSCINCRDCLYLGAAGCNPTGYYHIYTYNHTTCEFDDKGKNMVFRFLIVTAVVIYSDCIKYVPGNVVLARRKDL